MAYLLMILALGLEVEQEEVFRLQLKTLQVMDKLI